MDPEGVTGCHSVTIGARAAMGITVKSGWTAVVLLTGSPTSPHVVDSGRIELCDPAIPESRQPYHLGVGTARGSGPEPSRLLRSVRRFGRESATVLILRYRLSGHRLAGAGVVVGSLIDPARIANDHIRIHALEGQLFRSVVEDAAARNSLPCSIWRERDLHEVAAGILNQSGPRLRDTLAAAKRTAHTVRCSRSWRTRSRARADR